jgi:hypothetical protein
VSDSKAKVKPVQRWITSDHKEWNTEDEALIHQQFLDIKDDFKRQGFHLGELGEAHAVYVALKELLRYYDVALKPEYQPKPGFSA